MMETYRLGITAVMETENPPNVTVSDVVRICQSMEIPFEVVASY